MPVFIVSFERSFDIRVEAATAEEAEEAAGKLSSWDIDRDWAGSSSWHSSARAANSKRGAEFGIMNGKFVDVADIEAARKEVREAARVAAIAAGEIDEDGNRLDELGNKITPRCTKTIDMFA